MKNYIALLPCLLTLALTSAPAFANRIRMYPIMTDQEIKTEAVNTCTLKAGGSIYQTEGFIAMTNSWFGKTNFHYVKPDASLAKGECSDLTDLVVWATDYEQLAKNSISGIDALEKEIRAYSPATTETGRTSKFWVTNSVEAQEMPAPQNVPLRLLQKNNYCYASPTATIVIKAEVYLGTNERAQAAFYQDPGQDLSKADKDTCLDKTVVFLDHETQYTLYKNKEKLDLRAQAQAAVAAQGLIPNTEPFHYLNSFLRRQVLPLQGSANRLSCNMFEDSTFIIRVSVTDEYLVAEHRIDPSQVKANFDCQNGELVVIDRHGLELQETYAQREAQMKQEQAASELARQKKDEEARQKAEQDLTLANAIQAGQTVQELKGYKVGDSIPLQEAVSVIPLNGTKCQRIYGVAKILGFDPAGDRALISFERNDDTLRYLLAVRNKERVLCPNGSLLFMNLK